ncbi:MAG: hypothetical protein JNL50_04770 [Phycisphaerae bacterium]|nr:hypothetical protein [Phycisphaerae bacterium]
MARSVRAARNVLVGALALGALSFIAAPLAAQQDSKPAQNPGQAQPTQGQPGQPEGRQPGQPGERRGQPGGPGGPRAGGPQNAEGAMKGMNRAIRNLNRALDGTGTAEDALKTIAEAQAACAQCRMFKPEHANDDAGKVADYRKRLIGVSRALLDIEEQLLAGKNAEAKAALEKIKSMQEDAHKAFDVKDE